MAQDFKYIELSFISNYEEMKRQIRNTVAISFLFNKGFQETILNSYLENTQYGYTASANEKGTHRLVRITDIVSGEVNWDNVPHCNCDSENKYLLGKGDILVARTGGTTGKSFLITSAPSNAIFASYLIRLRTRENSSPEFISIFLNSYAFWSQISELKSGSAQPNVNAEKLKTLVIPECSQKVQNKIVQVLNDESASGNDEFATELKREIDSVLSRLNLLELLKNEFNFQRNGLKELSEAILQEAVQGKLTKQDKNDESADKVLKRVKMERRQLNAASKLKGEKELVSVAEHEIPFELPQGWVWCRLGDLGHINPRNSFADDKDVSFVPMNLVSSSFGEIPKFEIRKWEDVKTGFTHFAENDVAVAKITPCFENSKAGLFKGLINGVGAGTTELHIFRKDNKYILPEYVYLFFKSPYFLKNGESKMTGSAGQKRISTDFIKSCVFPFPPLSEQHRIVAKVRELLRMVNQLEQQLAQTQSDTQELLQTVLTEAFGSSGKLHENNAVAMSVE